MATAVPAGPVTVQPGIAAEPVANSVKLPTGTVGVSKLAFVIRFASAVAAAPSARTMTIRRCVSTIVRRLGMACSPLFR
jgi:hypothetical protein